MAAVYEGLPARPLWGLILLLTAAVVSSASSLWQAVFDPPDPRARAERDYYDQQRFKSVKHLLPRSGQIGYREDDPENAGQLGPVRRFAQYVLAPVILRDVADEPYYVLVDGRDESFSWPQARGRPLALLNDAGNGVRYFVPNFIPRSPP